MNPKSTLAEQLNFPEIWNDAPQDIARFNQCIGRADDGRNCGKESSA
ncbi:hypothetical protein [Levilactobacillus yiduensis]|nr:hypothetical protein [Levilactobacillus yiduensis]